MTERQIKFIEQYYKHRNATKAVIEAGYEPKAAGQIGYKLLKHPEVKERLKAKFEAVGQVLDIEEA